MKRTCLLILFLSCFALRVTTQPEDESLAVQVIDYLKARNIDAVMDLVRPSEKALLTAGALRHLLVAIETNGWDYYTGRIYECDYNGINIKGHGVISAGSVYQIVMIFTGHKLTCLYIEPATRPNKNYSPPAYQDSLLYRELPVVINTGPFLMGGTVTIPVNRKSFPIIVFVHGSGRNNRDEELFALKPFRDMAVGLAARGIASLRYDKRNKIYGNTGIAEGGFNTIGSETTDDAASAISHALLIPGVNPKQIYVLGHSQGGMMLPVILKGNRNVAGGIFMSAPSIPLLQSYEDEYKKAIMHEGTRQQALGEIEIIKHIDTVKDDHRMLIGQPAGFWRGLKKYDQLATVKDLKTPLLFLQGGRDYQVPPEELSLWQKNLKGKQDAVFRTYPKLNHFYSEGEGAPSSADYYRKGNVPQYVIADIATWILEHKK